jgi:hypothetical protein
MGVDTLWEFRLLKAANRFDYRTIADVLIIMEYTALNSFTHRQQVFQTLTPTVSGDRPCGFRSQFADHRGYTGSPRVLSPHGDTPPGRAPRGPGACAPASSPAHTLPGPLASERRASFGTVFHHTHDGTLHIPYD